MMTEKTLVQCYLSSPSVTGEQENERPSMEADKDRVATFIQPMEL